MARHELDARRLLCPLPVIRTQNAMKALAPGDVLVVTATDPGVLQDIPAWCRINGHRVTASHRDADGIVIEILHCGRPPEPHRAPL
jgi:tRNA 2-thiouridine synthesizing protein A